MSAQIPQHLIAVETMDPDKKASVGIAVFERYKSDPEFVQIMTQMSVDAVMASSQMRRAQHALINTRRQLDEARYQMSQMIEAGAVGKDQITYHELYTPIYQVIQLFHQDQNEHNQDIAVLLTRVMNRLMTLERIAMQGSGEVKDPVSIALALGHAKEALEHSEPKQSHYIEARERHRNAIESVEKALKILEA